MFSSYILIVYLASGGLRVSMEPDFWACSARVQFEARFDPRVFAKCVPHDGSAA